MIFCSQCGKEKLWFGNRCLNCHPIPAIPMFKKGDRVMQVSGRYKWANRERVYTVEKRESSVIHILIAEGCSVEARAVDFRRATPEEVKNAATDRFMEAL